jgi:hypothetical protein
MEMSMATKGNGDVLAAQMDDRTRLVFAAVQGLLAQADVAPVIAAASTSAFVQIARAAFRRNGLTFSDDELRNVHDGLRVLVAARQTRPE